MKNIHFLLFGFILVFTTACAQEKAPGMTKSATMAQASSSTTTVDYVEDAADINPALPGTQVPNPQLRTTDGDTVQLMNLVSQQPSVLIFYRGGWCPYCNTHMAELQQAEADLVKMGYQLLAISPDRPEKLKESIAEHNLSYTLLSDSPMKAASAFGLAFKVDQETLERYDELGIDLEGDSGYDHHLLPVPAVFLVDTEGLIHFQYVNPDYRVRINSNVLLTAAEEYYPDDNGS